MTTRPSDRELVEATLGGSHEAFGELVARYQAAVLGVAFHRLGNFDDARDAAQEALIQAYLHLPSLRAPDRFVPWLYRIADATALNLCRRRRPYLPLESLHGVAGSGPSPQERAERMELAGQVREALASLAEPTRLAVILHYMDGYSTAEVAEFLGTSPGAVRTRLSRAKQHLRREMAERMGEALRNAADEMGFSEQFLAGAIAALRAFGPPTASRMMVTAPDSDQPAPAGPDWTEMWVQQAQTQMAARPDEVLSWFLTVGQGRFQHFHSGLTFLAQAEALPVEDLEPAVCMLATGARLAILHRLARGSANLATLAADLAKPEEDLSDDLKALTEWRAVDLGDDSTHRLTGRGAQVVCLLWHLASLHYVL